VKGLVIRGNLILNNTKLERPFRGTLQGIGFFDGPYVDCIIENNIVIVEHFHGITLFAAYNCRIINNTVLPQPGTFPYQYGPPWIGIFSHKNGTHSENNIVRNNLTTNMILEKGSSIADHNLVDPVAFKFVNDYMCFDFSPKPYFVYGGNFIIDNGTAEFAPEFDFNGIKRPQGKAFDIGAIEYIPNEN
jgi:parallel beta-helix repeat protein